MDNPDKCLDNPDKCPDNPDKCQDNPDKCPDNPDKCPDNPVLYSRLVIPSVSPVLSVFHKFVIIVVVPGTLPRQPLETDIGYTKQT